MSLCTACGLTLNDDTGLCRHHSTNTFDDWAVSNKIMCDFFHRKKLLIRMGPDEEERAILQDNQIVDDQISTCVTEFTE